MIIVYNLPGFILGAAGLGVGLFVFMLSGWLSAGLLMVAVVWFAGGFWWRNREVAPGVKQRFPALYFIPLPILAVPVAILAALFLVVELGGGLHPADQQAKLARAAERSVDEEVNEEREAAEPDLAERGAAEPGTRERRLDSALANGDQLVLEKQDGANSSSTPETPSNDDPKIDPSGNGRGRPTGDKSDAAQPAAPTAKNAEPASQPAPAKPTRSSTGTVPKSASKPAPNSAPKTASKREPRSERKPASRSAKSDDGKSGAFRRFTDMRWGVKSLAFSPTAGLLAAGKQDRALMLFDVAKNARLEGLDKLQALRSVTSCLFTPDGSRLLVGGSTGQIQIFDASPKGQLAERSQFVGHSQEVSCIAVSGDGKLAVSGGKEKSLRFWEVESGRELAAFPGCEGPIKACFIAKNGRTALATDGATLLSIDLNEKQVVQRQQLARSWAAGQAAAFSADGGQVAVGDHYSVRLWDLKSLVEMPKLEDKEIQWSMAFTPDGTRLVSGGSGKVNVWDVRKQRKIQAISVAGNGYIQSLAVSHDNMYVAAIPSSAGQDLQVFRLDAAD